MDSPQLADAAQDAQSAARRVGDHPLLERLARWGFVVSGLLHVAIGYLALRVAWSGGGEQADQSGALATLASNPLGTLLMVLIAIGLAALVLWQITLVVAPSIGEDRATDRVKAAGRAVVYAALAITATQFALGSGSAGSSEQTSQDVTAAVMSQPAGRWLVGAAGIGVIAVGAYHVVKGVTRRFLRDLEDDPGQPVVVAGVVGYVAKGVVLALVGGLFVVAAYQQSSSQADGLDGALKALRDQPFGPYLLTVVAVGLIAFGGYCVGRARHQRI